MKINKEQEQVIITLYNEIMKERGQNKQIAVQDIDFKKSIQVGDYTWSAFSGDKDGNTGILLDKKHTIKGVQFGEDNNYSTSNVRNVANDCEPSKQALKIFGKDAFIPLEIDLLSHDGLRDYGVCRGDLFGILNYDMYRNNRENIDYSAMLLATPESTPSGDGPSYVRCVCSGGGVGCGGAGWDGGGVRPFYILKSDIFVSLVE